MKATIAEERTDQRRLVHTDEDLPIAHSDVARPGEIRTEFSVALQILVALVINLIYRNIQPLFAVAWHQTCRQRQHLGRH